MILEAGNMRLELLRTQGEVLAMVAYGPGVPAGEPRAAPGAA